MLLHFAFVQLAWASGGAFAGVYLLKIGFSLPEALAAYAGIMCVRFFLRFAGIEIVRRVGYRWALAIGTVLCAFEFFAYPFGEHCGRVQSGRRRPGFM